MNIIGQNERATQNRVIALFRDQLDYSYLGDWSDRSGNSGSSSSDYSGSNDSSQYGSGCSSVGSSGNFPGCV